MNIVVCVKRVPDTETRIRVAADASGIQTDGVKYIMSPYDEFALEAGLQTKEALGAGEVALITLGDASAAETLRQGLAMGADRATLLRGPLSEDGLATAKTLADELAGADAPLILLGVKAADDDQQQVGPMLATLLDRPCATGVAEFEVEGDVVRCERDVEGGTEVLELPLPAVLTITKGKYVPRYASLKGIMAAKKKPLEEKDASSHESRLAVQRMEEPAARPDGRIVGEGVAAVPELVRLLREEAKVL